MLPVMSSLRHRQAASRVTAFNACFRCVFVASLHTSMHIGARRRSGLSSTQPLPPPPVWHDGDLINDDGEHHTDRRKRFTRQGCDGNCDARMSRDRREGEHRAVVFIGSAQEVTSGQSAQRDDHDGAEGAFADDRSHPRPAQNRESYEAEKKQTAARLLDRRNPPLRGREEASDDKPNAERKQQCTGSSVVFFRPNSAVRSEGRRPDSQRSSAARLEPATVQILEWLFPERKRLAEPDAAPADERYVRTSKKFGAPRFRALYRQRNGSTSTAPQSWPPTRRCVRWR